MAKTWDLTRCIVTVNGVPVSGFGDGDAFTWSFNEDAYKLSIGADGEGCRSKTNNRSAKLTFSLKQLSLANTVFEAYRQLDDIGNIGQVPIMVRDLNSGSSAFALQAWVMKAPDMKMAEQDQNREWVWETAYLDMVHAGAPI